MEVATIIIPEDTPEDELTGLFTILEDAGYDIQPRDGFDSRDATAWDIIQEEP